jgi:hypothetical protein
MNDAEQNDGTNDGATTESGGESAATTTKGRGRAPGSVTEAHKENMQKGREKAGKQKTSAQKVINTNPALTKVSTWKGISPATADAIIAAATAGVAIAREKQEANRESVQAKLDANAAERAALEAQL